MGEAKRREEKDATYGMKIVPYAPSDFNSVIAIFSNANTDSHEFLPKEIHEKHLKTAVEYIQNGRTKTEILKRNGQVLGFISLVEDKKIAGLFIHPDWQSKGLGTRLLKHVKSSYPYLELAVYEQNEKAVNFYNKSGFKKDREEREDEFTYYVMKWENGK